MDQGHLHLIRKMFVSCFLKLEYHSDPVIFAEFDHPINLVEILIHFIELQYAITF